MRVNIGAFGGSWTDTAREVLDADDKVTAAQNAWEQASGTMTKGQTIPGDLKDSATEIAKELMQDSETVGTLAQQHGEALGEAAAKNLWQNIKPAVYVGVGAVVLVALVAIIKKKR